MNAQTTPIDDDGMPAEIDFSGAKRGQFYKAGVTCPHKPYHSFFQEVHRPGERWT